MDAFWPRGGRGGGSVLRGPGRRGVGAMGRLEGGDVLAVLVGDEALEAVPVDVGEGELRAGVGTLAPADQPGSLRPTLEVDLAGQLGNPGAVTRLAIGVDRGLPG